MKLINLTPHEVVIYDGDQIVATLPSQGLARCESTTRTERCHYFEVRPTCGWFDLSGIVNVPVNFRTMGAITGLPAMDPFLETSYLVSRIVAEAAPDRPDLFIVDDTVRGEDNRIIGCRAFGRLEKFSYEGYLKNLGDTPEVQIVKTSDNSGKGFDRTLVVRSSEEVEDEIFHCSIRRIEDEPNWVDLLPADARVFDPTTRMWVKPIHLCKRGTAAYTI